ncbi:MAG: peptidylprolyl isomerase [Azonexus sp.]|nr:peptidylprolyl isomerase [Azonexus sp.]
MKKALGLTALLVASLAANSAIAQTKPFVTVNGQAISQSVFDAFIGQQRAQGAPDSPELQGAVREELIRRELLAQEARKKGLDKKPAVQGQVELAKQAVLISAFVTEYLRANPISDAQLKAEYDLIKSNLGNTEYRSRHVLVEKEEDAKAIIAKLDKGEKLADLAKQSKDPGSREKGGDLGWSPANTYVKPFADALVALKKGEYTKQPVKSDFGYHVIQLEDSRALQAPSFDQVKPQLQQRASQMQVENLVKELRGKAKVN